MALSEQQMLLLDCFMYTDIAPKNEGSSLGDAIECYFDANGNVNAEALNNAVKGGQIQLSGDFVVDNTYNIDSLTDVLKQIHNDPQLCDLLITQTTDGGKGTIRAACFYDGVDATVAFRGTGGSYEQWYNNFEGYGDVAQQSQLDAAEFINSLPFSSVEVTGHSNGANQAMYVSVVCGDKVSRCVAYEGQGFSDEFCKKYQNAIYENQNKIKNICGSEDMVSPLMNSIAGETVYVESDSKTMGHGSYGLLSAANRNDSFDENGNFKDSAYVEQAEHCKKLHTVTVWLCSLSQRPDVELLIDCVGILAALWFDSDLDARIHALEDLKEALVDYIKNKLYNITPIPKIIAMIEDINYICNYYKHKLDSFIYSGAYQYVADHNVIDVDTYKLQYYADRLTSINKRIAILDREMDNLYWKVGLSDILELLKADLLTSYSFRLRACASYLSETANNFTALEGSLIRQL